MDTEYKHLTDDNLEQTPEGGWVPAIPLAFAHGKLWHPRKSYECPGCLRRYHTEAEYRMHYRTAQLSEMNEALGAQRDVAYAHAKFWRRTAFIYRNGKPAEVTNLEHMFDGAGWPDQTKDVARVHTLNDTLVGLWSPVYERVNGKKPKETAEVDVEDQTPDEAKGDFADPYTIVNSKGKTYYLNMKMVALRGGKMTPIYFFTQDFRPQTAERVLPDGYKITENPRNGFMTVSRISKSEPGHKG